MKMFSRATIKTLERSGVMEVRNSTKTNIEDKLRNWNWLEKRRRHLERIIPEQEERLNNLRDKLSSSGILSSITQQTINMDMPRGGDVSDKVGNMVANTLEKTGALEMHLNDLRLELARIYGELADIEFDVYQLKESYQIVITRHFRDGWTQNQIADACYFSQQRVDQIIRKVVRSFRRTLI